MARHEHSDTVLTKEIVRELLDYEPETGVLLWRARDRKWFNADRHHKGWNTRYPGKEAFTSQLNGTYRTGLIFSRPYLAHRVIWLWMMGAWPESVDHINGDPIDNRWVNLREVTLLENMKNQRLRPGNTTGVTGVVCSNRKWVAQICANGKRYYLGSFENKKDAIAARKAAEREHGFHPNHGLYRAVTTHPELSREDDQ